MKKAIIATIILIFCAWSTIVLAKDLTSTDFIVRDPVVGTGGGYQTSASFQMYGAGNMNVSGKIGNSSSFQGRAGVLQYPAVTSGVLSASVSGSTITPTWTASAGYDGYNVIRIQYWYFNYERWSLYLYFSGKCIDVQLYK